MALRVATLAHSLLYLKYRTLAARRALESIAYLYGINIEFGDYAAECIAVHAKLFGSLTLVSLVVCQYGEQITALEFAHSFSIGDSARMHCCHKGFQFAFHKYLSLATGYVPGL